MAARKAHRDPGTRMRNIVVSRGCHTPRGPLTSVLAIGNLFARPIEENLPGCSGVSSSQGRNQGGVEEDPQGYSGACQGMDMSSLLSSSSSTGSSSARPSALGRVSSRTSRKGDNHRGLRRPN
eukprot:scaffold139482_cov22-Tisochrysis_lutea.AAC.1